MINNAWKEILVENNIQLGTANDTDVDERLELSGSSWLAALPSRAVLMVSGADAHEFLHGQFSNDLNQLDQDQWQLSSYSTPKGRLLAVFRIAKIGGNYYLEMPHDIIESFQKRLQMFVMRSQVKLENLSDEMLVCGLVGADSTKHLQALGHNAPADVSGLSASLANDILIMREAGDIKRYLILARTEKMRELWQTLDNSVLRTTENTWALSQIENGQPDVFAETKEQFVAQMMNLHVLGAVNFKKGCYPGQEVVARLQYLGKLKRRMYRFSANCQTLPAPGSEVFLGTENDVAGKVALAAYRQAGTVEVLAVMKVASVESDRVLRLAGGESLENLELPYAFAEQS